MDPLILEVRANEFADFPTNRNVPFNPASLIADAEATAAAGASIYHWHARADDGAARPNDVDLQEATIRGIRARTDLLLHMTLGFTDTQGNARDRLRTVTELLERGQRPDMVPVDIGAVVADMWDPDRHQFTSDDKVLLNRTGYLTELIAEISRLQVPVQAVVWSPGAIRLALRLRDACILTVPVYWQFGFTADAMPGGTPATPRQLDAFLDELPAGEPWNVHVREGDGLALAAHAILRGGHVAIGLGDDPYDRLGNPTNADLVSRLHQLATTIGRPVATPSGAAHLLGLSG